MLTSTLLTLRIYGAPPTYTVYMYINHYLLHIPQRTIQFCMFRTFHSCYLRKHSLFCLFHEVKYLPLEQSCLYELNSSVYKQLRQIFHENVLEVTQLLYSSVSPDKILQDV